MNIQKITYKKTTFIFLLPEQKETLPQATEAFKKGVEEFINQALQIYKEKGEEELKKHIESKPEYWEAIEKNLKDLNEKQRSTIKKLLEEVKKLQSATVEWLPEYPITKKIGVIINGDSIEERHKTNTERAIQMMRNKGFTEIYVAQHASVKNKKGIKQYSGDKRGLDNLFTDLKQALVKDSLVFVYGTGHGSPAEEGAMYLPEAIGKDEIKSYMSVIKEKKSRIVGVFDSCYSGVFPKAIIEEAGLEGIVLSPGIEGEETYCQDFAPYFFEGLDFGRDINKDKMTEVSEAFVVAMQIYRQRTESKEYGEFMRSKVELTSENFDRLLKSGKPALIDISATWCGPCRQLSKDLAKLSGLVGEQINIVTITSDINPEKDELYKKLGISRVQGFPTLLLKIDDNIESLGARAISIKELQDILATKNIAPNEENIVATLSNINTAKESPDLIFQYIEKIKTLPQAEEILKTAAEKYPWGALEFAEKYKELPYAPQIIEKAVKFVAKEDLFTILQYADSYKNQPYAAEIIENAIKTLTETMSPGTFGYTAIFEYADKYKDASYAAKIIEEAAKKTPGSALRHADRYKDQPYAAKIIEEAAKKDPWSALRHADRYKDQPYAAKIIEEAAKEEPWSALENADRYKDQPYAAKIIKEAAKEYPDTAYKKVLSELKEKRKKIQ